MIDIEEFKEGIHYLFNPEPDEDGLTLREYPNERLRENPGLVFEYMENYDWEGSSINKYTRICAEDEEHIHTLTRNQDVPYRLFISALHLFADSIIEYHSMEDKKGDIRFYPPIVLTFWSGFESFVRYSSDLLLITVPGLPDEVVKHLREKESYVTQTGEVRQKSRYRGVLDRYSVFLRYAYDYEVDRGYQFWQALEQAKKLRDYYTHLNISAPRSLSSGEVLKFMETILLAIITPSSHLKRTLLLGVYWLHGIWTFLYEHSEKYTEQPFFLDWRLQKGYMFHCNFENVDKNKFPNSLEKYETKRKT